MEYYVCTNENNFANFLSGNTNNSTKIKCEFIEKRLSQRNRDAMRQNMNSFINRWIEFYNLEDKSTMYYKFKIPKAKGGFRDITAPKDMPAIMFTDLQNQLATCFATENNFATAHDNAYAYIKHRWCKPAVEKHQNNNSEYFAHFDIESFFTNTTFEFAMHALSMVYPYGAFMENKADKELFSKLMSIAFINNGLPQGTQVSPILTNIIMIPFDYLMYKIVNNYRETEESEIRSLVYTRYADDLIISSDNRFNVKSLELLIEGAFTELGMPYSLNTGKTTYKRNKGRSNFILGMQLNQDNNITIGRKRKREIRWQFHSFFNNREQWNSEDIMSFLGVLNYFQNVEPEVYELTMKYYDEKYGCDVIKTLREQINN